MTPQMKTPGSNRAGEATRHFHIHTTKPQTKNQKLLRNQVLALIEAAYDLDAVQNEIFELSKGGIGGAQ